MIGVANSSLFKLRVQLSVYKSRQNEIVTSYRGTTQAKLETKFSLNKMRAEKTKLSICCQTETTSVGL